MGYIYITTMIYIDLNRKDDNIMRIVWRDSKPRTYKPVKYRNHMATGSPKGWTVNLPGDNNIYASHYCALNAIDKALGGFGQMGSAKRIKYGIKVVGKKDDETA
jgi:hypothetical protein